MSLRVAGILLVAVISARPLKAQSSALPKFQDFGVADSFKGKPAEPDTRSSWLGRRFRTVIRRQSRAGPNFAGRFTVVRWGCGSSCIMFGIVDAISGKVYDQTVQTQVGAIFYRNSALLIADPADSARAMFRGEAPPEKLRRVRHARGLRVEGGSLCARGCRRSSTPCISQSALTRSRLTCA